MNSNETNAAVGEEDIPSCDSAKEAKIHGLLTAIASMEQICFSSDPIRRTYAQFRVPLYLRIPGCYLSAPYGSGKTITMDFCAAAIRAEIPGLPVFVVDEKVIPHSELVSFFNRALLESKYDGPITSVADKLRNRLVRHWAELSQSSPLHCVVLLLDEAQAMREADEAILKNLLTGISREGGSLQIFIFGESPALDLLVGKKKTNMNGARDRLFGGNKIPLSTYDSAEDWGSLFSGMDTQKFDILGGTTVVEKFFGHLDASKFQMKNEAKKFYAALKFVKSKNGSRALNLRRIFVGIRHAIFTTSVSSIHNDTKTISEIPKAQWIESLRFACGSTR